MKNLVGGVAAPVSSCSCGGGTTGTQAHCYGSQSNCAGQGWGGCKVGEKNCEDYCVCGSAVVWN